MTTVRVDVIDLARLLAENLRAQGQVTNLQARMTAMVEEHRAALAKVKGQLETAFACGYTQSGTLGGAT